ncbi:beta-galactosidase [Dactylosporangium sucinum]|uniref:Beta-galactosidase n=2 Tax=Dactylosporangium sucinum TaxID=1424081 RepID=A0A917WZM9_9ACTN|nr:beta-galactosidase [Dactylosporangium sucinum]
MRLAVAATAALTLAAGTPAAAHPTSGGPQWTSLSYTPAPADNPLKGFLPYAGSYQTFPYSMEWFYLPLRDVMSGPRQFRWDALERQLDAIAARGHQAVFRFYLDYPGKPTGIPQYLLDQGLTTHAYPDFGNNGVSVAPDYNDPRLTEALENFITAFGRRYDGDPRIGFVTLGLIGFWGEWHTWPYDGYTQPENWMPATDVLVKVLSRYEAAFDRTRLLARYPSPENKDLNIGYHDDSFAFETLPPTSWHFVQRLIDNGVTGKWRQQPVGGELRPEIQSCLWDAPVSCGQYEDYAESVAQTHASWLINHAAFEPGFTGDKRGRAVAASRALGYELTVTAAALGRDRVTVRVANRGAAPFYYDWRTELAAVDGKGRVVRRWPTAWTMAGIQPGADAAQLTTRIDTGDLRDGRYTIVMRVANPLPNGTPLRFANTTQDTRTGWLTLGTVSVR